MLGVTLLTSTMTASIKTQARTIAEKDKLLAETEKEKMRANLLRAVSHADIEKTLILKGQLKGIFFPLLNFFIFTFAPLLLPP